MQYIPVKTRILNPPQDDLFGVLDEFLPNLEEGDVLVVTSKVVSIDEGRCVLEKDFDKHKHIKEESDVIIPRTGWSPLTIINHVMVGGAGVDKSNSNGYYTLLPENPFESAARIHKYTKERFGLKNLGVVVTDSKSNPCRYGATGCAIGFWGIHPLESHIGKKDLFGRAIKIERTNVVDGIAAGANLLMGETAEGIPVVIARNIPNLKFEEGDLRKELFCPYEEDTHKVLYEKYL
jgi:coenzyme F420-0:L-glutamate ligase